jgi:LPS export ABC transporter protein LptC
MTFLGARVVEDRAGERLWEVAADRAIVFKGEGRAVLTRAQEPVRITLYSEGRSLEATAERAVIWMDRREVLLEGGILARSDQGITLRTDRVTWSADRRSLETDAPVTIERAGLTVEGEGMEADLTLERMMLKVHRRSRVTGQGKGQS